MFGWLSKEKGKPRTFISYSTVHADVVRNYAAGLRPLADVFFAEDALAPGEKIKPELSKQIKEAECFYLFWCVHAARSEWIAWELSEAVRNTSLHLVPLRLDTTNLPQVIADRKHNDLFMGACLPYDLAEQMGHRRDKYKDPVSGMYTDRHGYDGGFPDRATFDYYVRLKSRSEARIKDAIAWIANDITQKAQSGEI